MGLQKPIIELPLTALIDADALRHALTALAKETADTGTLRKDGLGLIKAAFIAGRATVQRAVEQDGLPGLELWSALSALQDAWGSR